MKNNEYAKDSNWWLELNLYSDVISPERIKLIKNELRRRKLKKIYIE